jgi:hypothetical protein
LQRGLVFWVINGSPTKENYYASGKSQERTEETTGDSQQEVEILTICRIFCSDEI